MRRRWRPPPNSYSNHHDIVTREHACYIGRLTSNSRDFTSDRNDGGDGSRGDAEGLAITVSSPRLRVRPLTFSMSLPEKRDSSATSSDSQRGADATKSSPRRYKGHGDLSVWLTGLPTPADASPRELRRNTATREGWLEKPLPLWDDQPTLRCSTWNSERPQLLRRHRDRRWTCRRRGRSRLCTRWRPGGDDHDDAPSHRPDVVQSR